MGGQGPQDLTRRGKSDLLGVADRESHSQSDGKSRPSPPAFGGQFEVGQLHELSFSMSYAKGLFGGGELIQVKHFRASEVDSRGQTDLRLSPDL